MSMKTLEIRRFRKLPVVIDTVQLTKDNIGAVAHWCDGTVGGFNAWINIPTKEGVMRADLNDWVVKGVVGEFYPVKPDIFDMTYEPE